MTTHWANWRAEVMRALDKRNLVLVRGDDWHSARSARSKSTEPGSSARSRSRPDLIGQGVGRPALVGALHELRRRGRTEHRRVLGRTDRSVRARRRARQQCLFRVPPEPEVNLLAAILDSSSSAIASRRTRHRASASTRRCPPRVTSCTSPTGGIETRRRRRAGTLLRARSRSRSSRGSTAARCPSGVIRDHPDLPVRGVMLDISRDKVPTMATMPRSHRSPRVVEDQPGPALQRAHVRVPQPSRGARATRVPSLPTRSSRSMRSAANAYVELVPNQNCLGHMNRWVMHEPLPRARARARRIHRSVGHRAATR